jgi:transcriptional regulator with XRE-family HTH domain
VNIHLLRKAQGLTQVEMSARLVDLGRPIPANSLSRIEIGQRRVDLDDLGAIAQALGTEPHELLDGTAIRGVISRRAEALRAEADRIEREEGLT